jgi:hypothetical protein
MHLRATFFRKSNDVRKISGNPKIDCWSEQWEALCKESMDPEEVAQNL